MATYNKMKILLIGSTGQLGKYLQLIAQDTYKIIAPTKSELDVTNAESIRTIVSSSKPNIIINTSAYHVVPLCEEQPHEALQVNAVAVYNLAKISREYNAKFITYSTDYVFDGSKGSPYVETDQPNPLQMYGISKLAGEYASNNYYPEGSYIIRTCGVYGGQSGSNSKKGNFVLNLLRDTQGKNSIEVSNDQTVAPTYAHDLAQATLQLLQNDAPADIYHLVNEGYCTWAEFATEILKITNSSTMVIGVDRSKDHSSFKRPAFSALSNTKAKPLHVILPTWQEGVKQYIMSLS